MKKKGEIAVFLALVLSILAGFLTLLIGDIRSRMCKGEATMAADAALRSIFGEYNKEVFDRFHIYLIDASYKKAEGNSDDILAHFAEYMQVNMQDAQFVDAEITNSKTAGENNCEYLYDMAVKYYRENEYGDNETYISKDDLFYEYCLSLCGNYASRIKESARVGELEYLIYGYKEDSENIEIAREQYEEETEKSENRRASYDDFLQEKLAEEDTDTLRNRFGYLVTEYARSKGSPGICLDECYAYLEIESRVTVDDKKEYDLTREYSYEERSRS